MPAPVSKSAAIRASNTGQSQINQKPCAARGHTLQIENAAAVQIRLQDSFWKDNQ
jgi:hypothetical protein